MLRTLEAIIDKDGNIRILEDLQLSSSKRALVTILDEDVSNEHADEALLETKQAEKSMKPETLRIDKEYYLRSIIASSVLILMLGVSVVIAIENRSDGVLFLSFSLIGFVIYSTAIWVKLWLKAWESIQDGYARATPQRAVGYSFIPIFNFYWIFQLSWGFAKDFNSYLDRHNISSPKLSEELFFSFAAFAVVNIFLSGIQWIGPIAMAIEFVLAIIVVSSLSNAVNSIHRVSSKLVSEQNI